MNDMEVAADHNYPQKFILMMSKHILTSRTQACANTNLQIPHVLAHIQTCKHVQTAEHTNVYQSDGNSAEANHNFSTFCLIFIRMSSKAGTSQCVMTLLTHQANQEIERYLNTTTSNQAKGEWQ
jgi:hypothetical protein